MSHHWTREICQCGKPLMPREHVFEEDDWNCRNRVPVLPSVVPADEDICTNCGRRANCHPIISEEGDCYDPKYSKAKLTFVPDGKGNMKIATSIEKLFPGAEGKP